MALPVHGAAFTSYHSPTGRLCPQCSGALLRAKRQPLDHLVSMFRPVRRYSCQNFDCQWHGSLPVDGRAASYNGQLVEPEPQRISVAGLITAAIIVAGTVLVVWVGMGGQLPDLSAMSLMSSTLQSGASTVA